MRLPVWYSYISIPKFVSQSQSNVNTKFWLKDIIHLRFVLKILTCNERFYDNFVEDVGWNKAEYVSLSNYLRL
jgi:hypothetical protein